MKKSLKALPWADLHCHSTASDGSLSPSELVLHAKDKGLKGLCLTDHDTLAGYLEAKVTAQKIGIHLGVGVEFSCAFQGLDLHLIGYDIDIEAPSIQALCQLHLQRRYERNQIILEKLSQEGMVFSLEALYQKYPGQMVGRPHIAKMMLERGYVKSIKEAFYRYIGEGKPFYAQGPSISVDETLEVIRASGGKSFIAHPHLLQSNFPTEALLQCPFNGIECFYGNFSQDKGRYWAEIAEKKGWIVSGGSDFHGIIKPKIPLGIQGVDEKTFYQIFERHCV
ncbi:MAG: PHP domain-containing protein [Candidatus Rhabdochlamydia sp.]